MKAMMRIRHVTPAQTPAMIAMLLFLGSPDGLLVGGLLVTSPVTLPGARHNGAVSVSFAEQQSSFYHVQCKRN